MDDMKECCRCKNFLLKSNFHKNIKRRVVVQGLCKICFKQYHNSRKEWRSILDKERGKTDLSFKLNSNIITRTCNAFRYQNRKKK